MIVVILFMLSFKKIVDRDILRDSAIIIHSRKFYNRKLMNLDDNEYCK